MNKAIHDRKCRDRYAIELKLAKRYRGQGRGITEVARRIGIDSRTIKHYLPTGWRDARKDNRGPERDWKRRSMVLNSRRAGRSVAEIATMNGISRQRVYQILAEEK